MSRGAIMTETETEILELRATNEEYFQIIMRLTNENAEMRRGFAQCPRDLVNAQLKIRLEELARAKAAAKADDVLTESGRERIIGLMEAEASGIRFFSGRLLDAFDDTVSDTSTDRPKQQEDVAICVCCGKPAVGKCEGRISQENVDAK